MFKSNMLFITVLCVVFCTTWSQESRIRLYMSPQLVRTFKLSGEICGNKYGVDPTHVHQILTWTIPHDLFNKQFLYCVLLKSGYIGEDGQLNIEEASTIVPIEGTQDLARRIYEKCAELRGESSIETAFQIAACYHSHFIITHQRPEA